MLFDVAEDDLTHTGVNTLRMPLCGKDADFGVCPRPVPHAGEEVIVPAVLLHPYKSHGLIRKAPCRQYFECFTEAWERDPEEQGISEQAQKEIAAILMRERRSRSEEAR